MRKTRLLSFVIALITAASAVVLPASAGEKKALPFKDVKEKHWFCTAVSYVYEKGIMAGLSDTEFGPNSGLSRAMFVTILGRLAGAEDTGARDSFKDTKKNTWYSPYVGWAVEKGVVTGYTDNTFKPNANISRQELAVAMIRYIEAYSINLPRENDVPYEFSDDGKIASWAYDYVDRLRTSGIVKGDSDANFSPKNSITRAETATIIMNLITRQEKAWQGYIPSPEDEEIILGAKYLYDNGTIVEGSLGTDLSEEEEYPSLRVFRDSLAEKWAYSQPEDTTGFSMGFIGHTFKDYPIVKICYLADSVPGAVFTTGSSSVNIEDLTALPGEDDGIYKTVYFDLTEAIAKYEGKYDNYISHFLAEPFKSGEKDFRVRYYGLFKNMTDAENFVSSDKEDYLKNYFVYSALDYKELENKDEEAFEKTITDRTNEILNSESALTPASVRAGGGKCYFISSVNGDDKNDGLSEKTPWKTLTNLFTYKAGGAVTVPVPKKGDGVFFERGSEFYAERYHDSQVSCLGTAPGVSYGAYGTGKKPMFSCAVDFHGSNGTWLKTEWENVWVLDKIDEREDFCGGDKCDIGNIIFNDGQYIGIRLVPKTDKAAFGGTPGMKTDKIGYCTNGMDFFVSGETSYENPGTALQHNLEYIHDRNEGKLYLYWDGGKDKEENPADAFDDIKVSRNGGCCWASENDVFDNLAFMYSANYGINADGDNITYTNCEFGFCNKSLAKVASGIELYGTVDGFFVRNCYFHEVGDGPMSAQFGNGEGTKDAVIRNILWENNVVLCCGCGAECWNSLNIGDDGKSYSRVENCTIKNNIFAYIGWGLSQHHGGPLLSGHVMNSTHSGGDLDTRCLYENNLIYKPYDSIFYSYVRLDSQKHGWDARNNIYVASPDCTAIAFEFENVNVRNLRQYKYRRVFLPYNERYISFMTSNGMDPAGQYYYYSGLTDAMKEGCFFESSYYIERGIKPTVY